MGLILHDGEIIELKNTCEKPTEGFEIDGSDFLAYEEQMCATWHTHPDASNNLSTNDHAGFLNWPNLLHYIVGTDGIACYAVQRGKIIRCNG